MKRWLTTLTLTTILLAAGCASVPMADDQQDAAAKQFTTTPDKAALYVYRNESLGGAVPLAVAVNRWTVGETLAKTYLRVDLAPGTYEVESRGENASTLTLTMEPGKPYYVWQEVKMGWMKARTQLHQTDEANGKAGVMESKLIVTTPPGDQVRPLDPQGGNSVSAPR